MVYRGYSVLVYWGNLLHVFLLFCTVEDDDFITPNPFTVTFNVGTPQIACATVSITDDTVLEGDHDFSVFIASVGISATIGTPDTTVIIINDNESKFVPFICMQIYGIIFV